MTDLPLDDPSFYEDFLVEAGEHFELIEQNFLVIEENPGDLDVLNAIFRSVHTIKGASGFLGLQKVQSLAHVGENILDDLRKGRMTPTPEVMEMLFETTDTLKVLVQDVGVAIRKQGRAVDPDITGLIRRLEALKGGGGPVKAVAAAAAPGAGTALPPGYGHLAADSLAVIAEAALQGPVLLVKAEFAPAMLQSSLKPTSLLPTVDLVGTLLHVASPVREEPTLDNFDPDQVYLDMVLAIRPTEDLETIRRLFGGFQNVAFSFHMVEAGTVLAVQPPAPAPAPAVVPAPAPAAAAVPEAPPAEAAAPPPAAESAPVERAQERAQDKGPGDTIRVSQAKLDGFMNTVAELIISKTMISHLVERLSVETRGTPADAVTKELHQASAYLDQVSKEIQASVLGIRMVPIRTIFGKFPRMLRDLAKASGKRIELKVHGEETEIDKSLVEELGDPLIHLIRNSADHGVEMPDLRLAQGKSETGTVVLRARHEGDSVIVEIEDDGKGIDPAVIRAKALEKGVISPERAQSLTDDEVVDLIFLPGFSTAQKITDISGRGVGMDVVRSNVRKLNGNVSVRSAVGKGSVFTIRLPLTLAIIDALLMRAGGQVFALPGASVEETLLVPRASIASLTRRKAINLRGEVLGVTRLRDLLRFHGGEVEEAAPAEDLPVVVVSSAGRRMGLIVDAFLRRQEVVIKPLAPYLASLPGISGASIMGDGGVVLILDPSELMVLATEDAP